MEKTSLVQLAFFYEPYNVNIQKMYIATVHFPLSLRCGRFKLKDKERQKVRWKSVIDNKNTHKSRN